MFRGVFPSFEAALASAPPAHATGYDHDVAGGLYIERTEQVYPADYPAMLWLWKAFERGARSVADFGGHIGTAYYAYRRFIPFPETLDWAVSDVPAVAKAGRDFALSHDSWKRLRFVEGLADAAGADLFFASGSLQYVASPLRGQLTQLGKPRWVVLNQLPVHPSDTYYTLQSLGFTYCPYRIVSHATLTSELSELGYSLRDRWENLEKSCEIVDAPEFSLDRYYGYCFELG
jgi:putative methyltransferase (TIGR04325 family)